MVLDDGSVIELNAGAKVDVHFTLEERRVELVSGEALFSVAKNPNRPFIVSAGLLSVRAIGTAFSVARSQGAVSVLVTEGKVRLDEPDGLPRPVGASGAFRELSNLVAGQRAELSTPTLPVQTAIAVAKTALLIKEVTPIEIERALSWQGIRLEFIDMRLNDVVSEFNRYNARKLVIADAETASIVVGGNFRADNVDTFVRLLCSGFGVKAEPRGNQIILRSSR
jgi:transmembrane sensor